MKKEKKPIKVKRITLILIVLFIIFLTGNVFAALVGAPNIFFAIKNLVVQEDIQGKDNLLSDKEIIISYMPIEITDEISLQINKILLEENKSTLFINVSNDGVDKELGFRVETDENGNDATTLGQAKYVIETGSNEKNIELTGKKINENDSIVLVVYSEEDNLRKITIDLANKEILVEGKDGKIVNKISESELKQYLGCFALLNCDNFGEKENNDMLIYISDMMNEKIFKDEMKEKTHRQLTMDIIDSFYSKEYETQEINQVKVLKLSGKGYEYDRQIASYTPLTEMSEVPSGLCTEIKDIKYKDGIYTVEFTYCLPTGYDYDSNRIEELPIYEATIKLELNEDSEYSKYKVIELSTGKEVTIKDKNANDSKYEISGEYLLKPGTESCGVGYEFENGKVIRDQSADAFYGKYEIIGNKIEIKYNETCHYTFDGEKIIEKYNEEEVLEIIDSNTLKDVENGIVYIKYEPSNISDNKVNYEDPDLIANLSKEELVGRWEIFYCKDENGKEIEVRQVFGTGYNSATDGLVFKADDTYTKYISIYNDENAVTGKYTFSNGNNVLLKNNNGVEYNLKIQLSKDKPEPIIIEILSNGYEVIYRKENNEQNVGEQLNTNSESRTITKGNVTVTYTSKIERELNKGKASYIYKNWIPKITGLTENVSSKIENQIKTFLNESYNQDIIDNKDEDLMEILENYSETGITIGFDVIYELEYVNDKIITFKRNFTGSLGGVPWDGTSGISFDITTGEILTLGDVVTNGTKCTEIAKNYIMQQLKNDENFYTLDVDYEKVIDELVKYNAENELYLNEQGFIYIVPKYAITAGVNGEYRFVVEYEKLKECINIDKIK